jgi:electron-transferring-flavoprotein dehydrogenase
MERPHPVSLRLAVEISMNLTDRETSETDVLIVGAGPAGLTCALRLADMYARHGQHNDGVRSAALSAFQVALNPENISVLEKASEVGAHSISGALLDPAALHELIPNFESHRPPLQSPVTQDAVFYLTSQRRYELPVTPPSFGGFGIIIRYSSTASGAVASAPLSS